MDDNMHRIAPSDLLLVNAPESAGAVMAEMITAQELPPLAPPSTTPHSLPRSRPPARSVSICNCNGHGTLLELPERARADRLVVLDTFGTGARARALVPCHCAAGHARAKTWRNLPDEADGVLLTNGRIKQVKAQQDAVTKVKAFISQPRGWLTLAGGYGVGKTMLIYACLNHLADQGIYGRYVMMPELLNELRDAIGTDLYGERLRRLIAAPILAVDELDKTRDSPFVDDVLHAIFLARYQRRGDAGTIIGYNLDGAARIPAFLASRIQDGRFRLAEMTDKDLRPIADKLDPWDRGEEERHA